MQATRKSRIGNLSQKELKKLVARGWTPMLDEELRICGLQHNASRAYAELLTQHGVGGMPAGNYAATWVLHSPNEGMLHLAGSNVHREYLTATEACLDLERNIKRIGNAWRAGSTRWSAEKEKS